MTRMWARLAYSGCMARDGWLSGRYELIEPAGGGGMATVWRGRTSGAAGFSRLVAIKRMLPSLSESEEFAAMFVEEARVVADLSHPHIVQVHDFGKDERGGYYIVMEWVEGTDLGHWLYAYKKAGLATPWPCVARIGAAIARALSWAHVRRTPDGSEAPVFHRDVTPSNILLDIHGTPKLSDFGLARAMDRVTLTTPGVVKGKLAYVAPELVGGQKASAASDLYSLGVVLWETLAGRRLFDEGDELALFVKVGASKIQPIEELRPDIPPALARVVRRATEKAAHARYRDGRELARDLEQVLHDDGPSNVDELAQTVAAVRARTLGQ